MRVIAVFAAIAIAAAIPLVAEEKKIVYRVSVSPKQYEKTLGFLELDVWGAAKGHVDVLSNYEFVTYLEVRSIL